RGAARADIVRDRHDTAAAAAGGPGDRGDPVGQRAELVAHPGWCPTADPAPVTCPQLAAQRLVLPVGAGQNVLPGSSGWSSVVLVTASHTTGNCSLGTKKPLMCGSNIRPWIPAPL